MLLLRCTLESLFQATDPQCCIHVCRDLKVQLAVLLYFANRFEEARALLKDLPERYGVKAFIDKMSLMSKG